MPIPRPCRSLPSRPLPSRPRRIPDSRQPMRRSLTAPPPDPALDEIAARVTGAMVNAGIASIDDLWSRGQPLAQPLATYTWLARAASRRHTAGLWTLIAWIHWRGNDRQAAWPALHLALDIDPDQDPPPLPRRVHVRPRRPALHPPGAVPVTILGSVRVTPTKPAGGHPFTARLAGWELEP